MIDISDALSFESIDKRFNDISGISESTLNQCALNIFSESAEQVNNAVLIAMHNSKEFSYNTLVNMIYDNFFKALDEINTKAIESSKNIFANDKILYKYEDKIKEYKGGIDIENGYYHYTCSADKINFKSLKIYLSDKYQAMYNIIIKMFSEESNDAIINEKLSKIYNKSLVNVLNDNYYDICRGNIMGLNNEKIFSDIFDIRLNSVFHNNEDCPVYFTINSEKIKETYNDYIRGKEYIESITNTKNLIKKICYDSKPYVKRLGDLTENINNIELNNYKTEFYITGILKSKCIELSKVLELYGLAYSRYASNTLNLLNQDKEILYKTIQVILNSTEVQ